VAAETSVLFGLPTLLAKLNRLTPVNSEYSIRVPSDHSLVPLLAEG
jgi:hypothetical protein